MNRRKRREWAPYKPGMPRQKKEKVDEHNDICEACIYAAPSTTASIL